MCPTGCEQVAYPNATFRYQGLEIAPGVVGVLNSYLAELLYSDTLLTPPREEIGWWAENKPGRPGRMEICPFEQVDLAETRSVQAALQRCPFGPVDIVLTHDALQHLSYAKAFAVLSTFDALGAEYLVSDFDTASSNPVEESYLLGQLP